MRVMLKRVMILTVSILLITACSNERQYIPADVKPADVNIVRFDSALLNVQTNEDIIALYAQYSEFMSFFSEYILGVEPTDTTSVLEDLNNYLNDTVYHFDLINEKVRKDYEDISDIREELNLSLGRLRYLYPEIELPEVTFFVSGFNADLLYWDSDIDTTYRIAVSLDMYLGADFEYYNYVVWNYQKNARRRECIVGDIVSAYLFRIIPFKSDKSRLLENMLYRGKVMYLLSILLPNEPDYEVMGYTKEQWDWAKHNEKAIWQMIVDKQDLWKTESPIQTSYLNDGPFTAEISQDAPPRLGIFIGWQIADSYMNNNKECTIQDFMQMGDAEYILAESHYRP